MKLCNFFLPVVFCAILTACSSENEIIAPDEETSVEYIITLAQSQIKPDVFKTQILDFGWRNIAEYPYSMKKKRFANHDLYCRDYGSSENWPEGVCPPIGAPSPTDFYFGEEEIELYYSVIHGTTNSNFNPDGTTTVTSHYIYDTQTNVLYSSSQVDPYITMTFEELKNDTLTVISKFKGGEPARIVFKRMSDEELEETKEKHRLKRND